MPTYQIEMLWMCRICRSADNRGLHKHCTNCGKPKDERDEERFPDDISEANALTGEAQRKALAGPDWKCKYCDSLQNSLGKCCGECGCDRNTGAKPWEYKGEEHIVENVDTGEKQVLTFPPRPPRPSKRVKPRIDVDPFRSPPKTEDLPSQHDVTPAPSVQDVPTPVKEFIPDTGGYRTPPKIRIVPIPWRPPSWLPKVAVSVLIAAVIFLILWLIFRTKIVDARVTGVSWQHDVIVDRWQVYRHEGWDTDPGAFEVHDEGRRIHHYDHVQVGSHPEHYTSREACGQDCRTPSCYTTSRSCTSNKNGTANCTGGDRVCPSPVCTMKYCDVPKTRTVADYEDQPRYRTWYSWKVWDWGYNRTVRAAGKDMKTRWPEGEELMPPSGLGQGEQERSRREALYVVSFSDDRGKESWTVKPKSLEDFQRFPPGSRYRLKVGIANGVTVVADNGGTADY